MDINGQHSDQNRQTSQQEGVKIGKVNVENITGVLCFKKSQTHKRVLLNEYIQHMIQLSEPDISQSAQKKKHSCTHFTKMQLVNSHVGRVCRKMRRSSES